MFSIFFLSVIFSQTINFSSRSYSKKADGSIDLKGTVHIEMQDKTLDADRVIFYPKSGNFIAKGHTKLTTDNGSEITGKILKGNLKNKDFIGENIVFKGKEGVFRGKNIKIIRRGKEKRIKIEKGSYTSCCNDVPDWEIWGSSINAKTEDYAYITNAVFKIKKIPFFYLPYVIFPTKTKRQSGILFPKFYFSSDGSGFGIPLYITLGKSHDMTITPGVISHRHYNLEFEFRSVFNRNSWQVFKSFYADDDLFGDKRLYLSLRNFFAVGRSAYILGKFAILSDIYIARDFPFMVDNSYDAESANYLLFSYSRQNWQFYSKLRIDQNLIDEDYTQRVPELRLSYNNSLGPVITDFELQFDRLSYNKYSDEDLYTSLNSRFSIPYNFFALDIKPSLFLKTSFLDYKHQTEKASKLYFNYDFSFSLSTLFYKNYKYFYHSIEPFIEYHIGDKRDPLSFYDFYDNLLTQNSSNYLVYGLRSHLQSFASLFLELKDFYDIEQAKREYFLAQLYGSVWLFSFNSYIKIPDFSNLDSSFINSGLRFGTNNNFLGSFFSYSKDTISQQSFYAQLSFWALTLYSKLVYSYLDTVIKEKAYRLEISPSSKCWSLKLEAIDSFEKAGTDYRVMFSLVFGGKTYGFEQ